MLSKRKNYINIMIILSFIFISLMSIMILYYSHTISVAGDMRFHFKRIFELKDYINHGIFFPKFAINQFHGSAVMSLYPYVNLFPIILLSYFVRSSINLIYCFFLVNTFICLVISFYSSFKFSKSRYISYLFSITYSLSSIFIIYYYGNMDLGVATSLVYLPLIIFGFIYLLSSNHKNWLIFPLGITLIIYSHILSLFLIIGFLFLWLIINLKRINKSVIYRLLYSILIVIFLTSIMWIPAFSLVVNNIGNIHPLSAPPLLSYRFSYIFNLALFNYPNFCLGLFAVIGLLLSICCYTKFNIFTKQMLWISLIILFLCSDFVPLKQISSFSIFKLLRVFQFTYRFYIFPQVLLCYLFAKSTCYIFTNVRFINKHKIVMYLIVVLCIISSQLLMQKDINNYSSYDNVFTSSFINKHIQIVHEKHSYINNGNIEPLSIKNKVVNFKSRNHPGYDYPKMKINKSSEIKLLCNSDLMGSAELDYYPMKSVVKENYINNNIAQSNDFNMPFKHVGFNKFLIDSKHNLNNVSLPLLVYNDEHIKLFRNKKQNKFHVNKYSLISTNIRKGKNIFYIKNTSNIIISCICIIMFVIGLLLYIMPLVL